jgi:Protein of unknown function (DUF1592)/Protein of unknown function (DUF1588)/Protein of unknown function (DUF1587)/Protein of unknown function (DUF1585)/Protein of unknown function (DUF1595)
MTHSIHLPARAAAGLLLAFSAAPGADFDGAVQPILGKTCAPCHNDRLSSGGFSVTAFLKPDSLTTRREGWEAIVAKLRAGEMPPKGIPRPPQAQMNALVDYVLASLDRNSKPDPGRVVARRLNRDEYANTVRDLLGVDFRADKEFPVDDSGNGFDNIGEVLSVSPVLMEKYMLVAKRIAARAIGADPLPKAVEIAYAAGRTEATTAVTVGPARRIDVDTLEAAHRVDFDGEYAVRVGLPGERPPDARPVALEIWMDGKLLRTLQVETKPASTVFFNPYTEAETRLYLTEGDHIFRVGFTNDDFPKTLGPKELFDTKKNKFPQAVSFIGPYPSTLEKPSRKMVLICDPSSGTACVTQIVSRLAHRAYRRPVIQTDIAPLVRLAALARAQGLSAEQSIQVAIQAILVSPEFLFRLERDPSPADPAQVHKIPDIELASRLSYFLWSSMPDDELLALAEAGKLSQPDALDRQIRRLLADPRSNALAENFAGQWLEIRNLDVVKPDPQRFPEWKPELRDAMRAETQMFFNYVFRENRPISDFLDARYTFLNQRLAEYYGIPGVGGKEFRKVDLTNPQRGGVLTQASVLTVSSYPTRTSVVVRGKYILENIFGTPPLPPPPDVPPLDEAAVGTSMSLRQQMEKHRADSACASCHARMDPLGFGLENYDAVGKWRTHDGKFPVDSSGTLPNGAAFSTPSEMRAALASELPQFGRCFTEKMLTYALGRGLTPSDRPAVDQIAGKLASSGYAFQTLIFEIAHSYPFQMGRGDGAPAPVALAPAAPAPAALAPAAPAPVPPVPPAPPAKEVARK